MRENFKTDENYENYVENMNVEFLENILVKMLRQEFSLKNLQ
jgi:hypothetical protein